MKSMQTTVTGAGPLTSPAVGLGCAEHVRYPGVVQRPAASTPLAGVTALVAVKPWVGAVAGTDAPFTGTGLPIAGLTAVRTTGAALVATTTPFHRSTPGDRPPEGPLG